MDTGVTPNVNSFRVVVDGTPIVPTSFTWFTNFFADILWGTPAATVLGTFEYITVDTNLRSSTGVVMTAPQSVQFFP